MGKKRFEWKEKIFHPPHPSLTRRGGGEEKSFYTQELVVFSSSSAH